MTDDAKPEPTPDDLRALKTVIERATPGLKLIAYYPLSDGTADVDFVVEPGGSKVFGPVRGLDKNDLGIRAKAKDWDFLLAARNDAPRILTALIERAERLADHEEGRRRVLAEECAPDEKHCACVPDLRAEIDGLKEHLKAMGAMENGVRQAIRNHGGFPVDGLMDEAAPTVELVQMVCESLKKKNEQVAALEADKARLEDDLAANDEAFAEVSKVYDTITGGRISNPNTMAADVLSEAEEETQRAIREALEESRAAPAQDAGLLKDAMYCVDWLWRQCAHRMPGDVKDAAQRILALVGKDGKGREQGK